MECGRTCLSTLLAGPRPCALSGPFVAGGSRGKQYRPADQSRTRKEGLAPRPPPIASNQITNLADGPPHQAIRRNRRRQEAVNPARKGNGDRTVELAPLHFEQARK